MWFWVGYTQDMISQKFAAHTVFLTMWAAEGGDKLGVKPPGLKKWKELIKHIE